MQHHFTARDRAAGSHEAQVTRRDLGFASEIELAHAAALTPFAQQAANGRNGTDHADEIGAEGTALPLPGR